jgi:hypothetical protein
MYRYIPRWVRVCAHSRLANLNKCLDCTFGHSTFDTPYRRDGNLKTHSIPISSDRKRCARIASLTSGGNLSLMNESKSLPACRVLAERIGRCLEIQSETIQHNLGTPVLFALHPLPSSSITICHITAASTSLKNSRRCARERRKTRTKHEKQERKAKTKEEKNLQSEI